MSDNARLVEAREYACQIFREHDRRRRELIEGRWDHHPMVAEYLARATLTPTTGKDEGNG